MHNRRISYSRIIGVAALLIVLIFGIDSLKRNAAKKRADQDVNKIITAESGDGTTTAVPPVTAPVQTGNALSSSYVKAEIDETKYYKLTKTKADLGIGELVLINGDNEYTERDLSESIVKMYENMGTSCYKLSYNTNEAQKSIMPPLNSMMSDFYELYNHNDVTITSALRSFDAQESIYNNDDEDIINSESSFAPGFTEHHTGYAIDLTLVSDSSKITKYDGTGDYAWINENCYKYGFIVRYPEDKEDVTGVNYEPWHFRYVGIPHSFIMHDNNFTLEEYINDLKRYVFGYEHLEYDQYGYHYEIYYVPADGDTTIVPVPNDRSYTVSGTNSDGFIVTICTLTSTKSSENSSKSTVKTTVTDNITTDKFSTETQAVTTKSSYEPVTSASKYSD